MKRGSCGAPRAAPQRRWLTHRRRRLRRLDLCRASLLSDLRSDQPRYSAIVRNGRGEGLSAAMGAASAAACLVRRTGGLQGRRTMRTVRSESRNVRTVHGIGSSLAQRRLPRPGGLHEPQDVRALPGRVLHPPLQVIAGAPTEAGSTGGQGSIVLRMLTA